MFRELDLTISLQETEAGILKAISEIRPKWTTKAIDIKQLSGGLMNKLMRCCHQDNEILLFKIYGNNSEQFMDRKKEKLVHKYLSEIGLTAPLVATFVNGIVYEYTPGRMLTNAECIIQPYRTKIAELLAKFHRCHPKGIKCEPNAWTKLNDFFEQIPEDSNKNKKNWSELPSKSEVYREIDWLRGVVDALNVPVVFCHNDLFECNIVYDEETDKVSFIDFEISDYNYQAYDFGLFFTYRADVKGDRVYVPDETVRMFLREYLQFLDDGDTRAERVDLLLRETKIFYLVAYMTEAVWSMAMIDTSLIEFDYTQNAKQSWDSYYKVKKELFKAL